jgi:hypothetical protein
MLGGGLVFFSLFRLPRLLREIGGEAMDDPLTQPSPPEGGEGLSPLSPLPVGEGWVRALLVFFIKKEPPTPASPVLPPKGEDFAVEDIPPFGGSDAKHQRGPCLISLRVGAPWLVHPPPSQALPRP